MKKKILHTVYILLFLPALFLVFLLLSTLFEYKPAPEIEISRNEKTKALPDSSVFSIMTWNIGYSGLGANMDFFYDGGERVRDTRENVDKNRKAIGMLLKANDTLDFILLQEVDIRSKRSYRINQLAMFDSILGAYTSYTGINYKVAFVPVPPRAPLGKVLSGITTFSRYLPSSSIRYAFRGNYAWPTSVFMLKRCYLVNRYPLHGSKEFLLINTHNSAYDDGSLRAAQLRQLAIFVENEYQKGNAVLIGGDWNQSPTGFKPHYDFVFDTLNMSYVPEDFLHGWQQIYPDSIPTNRRITTPYDPETSATTVIDFYIASPNIKVHKLNIRNLDFLNSDHQPVFMTFSLN
jgi:endonuclease/exonuclease/phosphatase family metal-dependent hydrolase